jgi:hypothetical protein
MFKATKTCVLNVHLSGGAVVTGRLHVDAATSSAMRPSDVLRQENSGWLLLTEVRDVRDPETPPAPVVLVNRAAVTMIELAPNNWRR